MCPAVRDPYRSCVRRAVASSASREGAVWSALSGTNAAVGGFNASADAAVPPAMAGPQIGASSFSPSWPRAQWVLTSAQTLQQDNVRLAYILQADNQGNGYQGETALHNWLHILQRCP